MWLVFAGCNSGGHHGHYLAGECDPAVGTVPVTTTQVALTDGSSCFKTDVPELDVVDSVAQWNALFDCSTAVPVGLDLTNTRAAVAHVRCTPLSLRFVSESDSEIVVGVVTGISGACIGEPVIVPLARSTKTVRLAQCSDQCDDCPPVP